MGTPSVIASKRTNKGRYCHWDGYPGYNGCQLIKLIQRDGANQVIKTIITDNIGWSSLDTKYPAQLKPSDNDTQLTAVEGYGVAYNIESGLKPEDFNNPGDYGWGYVICDDGLIDVHYGRTYLCTINPFDEESIYEMKAVKDYLCDHFTEVYENGQWKSQGDFSDWIKNKTQYIDSIKEQEQRRNH